MQKKHLKYFFILFVSLRGLSQEKQLRIFISDSNQLKTPVSYQDIHKNNNEALAAFTELKTKLTEQGFFNLTIDSTKNNVKQLTYYVSLNQKIDSVVLENHPSKKFTTIPIAQLTSEIKNITDELNASGQPFSKVKLINLHTEGKTLFAYLYIEESNNRTIDSIVIHNYNNFPNSYIKHYLGIEKGQLLNTDKIASKTESINNLAFASEYKKPEILFKEASTQLHLYIKKKNANYFDGYIGFGNNEDDNTFSVNGSVDIQLTNNLNTGETLKIYWKDNGTDRSEFEGSLTLPYLFNTKLTTNLALNITKQDSTFNNTDINIETAYNLNNKNALGAFYKNIGSTNASETNTNLLDYQSNFYGALYYYNKTNIVNPLLQEKEFSIKIATGNRKTSNTNTKQQLLTTTGFYQYTFTQQRKLFIKNETKILLSDNYLENELFYFGGINSIRGFSENNLAATLYTTVNLEYRQMLSSKLYIHSITDYNYNENNIYKTNNHLYSLGVGIGILNNQSIFKLNYALGWSTNSSSSLNDSKLHISYSAFF